MLRPHLEFLRAQMMLSRHMPTIFEYYSAIHLSQTHHTRFYTYRDLPHSHKKDAGFPLSDQGIDLVDETFHHIVQVKYYKPKTKITYGDLSTFLATPLLVGRKQLRLTLVRTQHCILHSDIQTIIRRGNMTDVALCSKEFLRSLKTNQF